MEFNSIALQIKETGLSIWPDFLNSDQLKDVRADFSEAKNRQAFSRAGIGAGAGHQVKDQIRQHEVCWLQRRESTPAQDILWSRLDGLEQALNRTLFLGLSKFDGHYSSYPPGGFYKRHRDATQGSSPRVISVIIYLNEHWKSADGGELRLFDEPDSNGPNDLLLYRDVAPVGGTLVCFLSQGRHHEVLVSHARRNSFTGWFKS